MTILQMECFVSIVETKKMIDTAKIIGIQPSNLSKYVKSMENEFSTQLLQKTSTGMELTQEGMLIYPSIRYILKKYDDLISRVRRYNNFDEVLKISSMFHQSYAIDLLNKFSDINPLIQLQIREQTVSNVQKSLFSNNIDVAVIYKEFIPKKYPYTYTISENNLVAIVNKDHHFARRKCISISELKDEKFILFKGDIPMYSFLLRICIENDFVPNEINLDLRTYTIMEYVKRENIVSLLMQNVVERYKDNNIVAIPLEEKPKLTMSFVFSNDFPSQACRKLIEYIDNMNC